MLTAAFFTGIFAPGLAILLLEGPLHRNGPGRYFAILLVTVGFVTQLYCVGSGIRMIDGWAEQVQWDLTPEEMASMSGRARGRGALALGALKFWPYVLIALHGYPAWLTFGGLRELRRDGDSSGRSGLRERREPRDLVGRSRLTIKGLKSHLPDSDDKG